MNKPLMALMGIATVAVLAFAGHASYAAQGVLSNITYLVGDAFPAGVIDPLAAGDQNADLDNVDIAEFGDDILSIQDLIFTLRAVNNIPGYKPPVATDRFDAMDVFPVDTPTAPGGDGVLNILDLVQLQRKVNNIDLERPRRAPCCSRTCPVPPPPPPPSGPSLLSAFRASTSLSAATAGDLQVGVPEPQADGSVRIPISLRVQRDQNATAFTFAFTITGVRSTLEWTAAPTVRPTLLDEEIPGTVSMAWLDPLRLRKDDVLALGTVVVRPTAPERAAASVVFYGALANDLDTKEDLTIRTPAPVRLTNP